MSDLRSALPKGSDKRMRKFIQAFIFLYTLSLAVMAGESCTLRVGLITWASPSNQEILVHSTIEALKDELSFCQIEVKRLSTAQLASAIKNKTVDVFISSSGFYHSMVSSGAREIASIVSEAFPDPNHTEASAIITLRQSSLYRIRDIKNTRLSALSSNAYPGYLFAMGEIAKQGYEWESFFKSVIFTGPENATSKAMTLLDNGEVDAVILKHCALEDYIQKYPEKSGSYRIVEPKSEDGVCLRSTDLYPGWTFASTSSLPPDLSREITKIMLSISASEGGLYWSVSTDFQSINLLHKTLRIGNYAYLREWTVKKFVRMFWPFIAITVLLLLGLLLHTKRAEQLVRQRTIQLQEYYEKIKRLEQRTEALHKLGAVNQLSSILAHEIRQPLTINQFYLDGLITLLSQKNIDKAEIINIVQELKKQNSKAEEIVQYVRRLGKTQNKTNEEIHLDVLIRDLVEQCSQTNPDVSVNTELIPNSIVYGSRLECELLVLNLLKNALEAVEGCSQSSPKIDIRLDRNDEFVVLCISDNGPKLSESEYQRIGTVFHSTKSDGLGLGLQIVREIAERQRGRVDFEPIASGGLKVIVKLAINGHK